MNFPVWDLGFAHGILIAIVAVLHVYVSHFAVGGGLFLVLTETLARRRNDAPLLAFVRTHSRFFILLTLVFGAISGVGIWFTIGLANPAGTSALIRIFVWGWAIEWVFFIVEIAAALIYYYGWDRLTPGRHLVVGWIYFGAAWFSMVVINGILSFQMTPGRWIETHAFWDGFLNPTYVPSLVTRTFFAFGLAGLFAVLTGSLTRDVAFKRRLLRYSGLWTVIPMAGVVLGGIWWWSAIPEAVTGSVAGATAGAMPFATAITAWIPAAGLVFVALVLLGPILLPRLVDPVSAMAITLIGLAVMGGGEWIREAVRKPYIIYDYMYVNGIRKADAAEIAREGYAANARWIRAGHASATPDSSAATSSAATSSAAASLAAASSAAAPPAQTPAAATPSVPIFSPPTLGEQVFRIACMNCHARRGYNGLAEPVLGWDHEFAQGVVKRLEHVRGSMPPWLGTDGEAGAVADFLVSLNPPGAALALPRDRLAAGRLLFESRCGICHTVSRFRGVRALVEGLSAEEIDAFMQDMESDQMPPFTGTDEQRMMLAEHLAMLGASSSNEGTR